MLRASMNTARASQANKVILDCRDEPGNDNRVGGAVYSAITVRHWRGNPASIKGGGALGALALGSAFWGGFQLVAFIQ